MLLWGTLLNCCVVVAILHRSPTTLSKAVLIQLSPEVQLLSTDATNSVYYINASVSSNTYKLLVDTASSVTWIHNNASIDSEAGLPFSLTYSGQQVSGNIVNQSFAWNSYNLNYSFGWSTSNIFENYTDGVLALPTNSSFINDLYYQNSQIDSRKFALVLSNSSGLMFLGNSILEYQQSFCQEATVYSPITANPAGYWLVNMTLNLNTTNLLTIVDTGTTGIVLPLAQANALHAELFGDKLISDNDGNYAFPCNYSANFNLTLGNNLTLFQISTEDFQGDQYEQNPGYCASKIQGVANNDYWILGQTFLKNYFTIFDVDTNNIGFAKLLNPVYEIKEESALYSSMVSASTASSTESSHLSATSLVSSSLPQSSSLAFSNTSAAKANSSSGKAGLFVPFNVIALIICICIIL